MELSELCRPHAGSRPPGRGQAVEVGAVVAVCHPDHLAIGEAGSGGEAHRSGCELRELQHGSGGGSLPVGVLPDDDARLIVADLSVTVLLGQGVAEVPGTVLIGGGVLPGSGGADHVVAGHGFVWLTVPIVQTPHCRTVGGWWSDSELDRFEVGGGISDVCVCLIVGDRLQDLQDLIPIAPTAEQGNGKVAGHEFVCISVVWWASLRAHPFPLYQAAK